MPSTLSRRLFRATLPLAALFALAGQRMWWPGKLLPTRGESTYEHRAHSAVAR